MTRRHGAVHVVTTSRTYKGTVYQTHLLRRSYREGRRVRNGTVGNLSHLPAHIIDLVRRDAGGASGCHHHVAAVPPDGACIARVLQMPRSPVSAILRRVGLGQRAVLDPAPVIQRYEWPDAGDLLRLDIKPLGRIQRLGHRVTGD